MYNGANLAGGYFPTHFLLAMIFGEIKHTNTTYYNSIMIQIY